MEFSQILIHSLEEEETRRLKADELNFGVFVIVFLN